MDTTHSHQCLQMLLLVPALITAQDNNILLLTHSSDAKSTLYSQCQCQSKFFTWLVIDIVISESRKAYKSKEKQYYNNKSGKNLRKKVFKCRQNIDKDGDDCTSKERWLQQLEMIGDRQ